MDVNIASPVYTSTTPAFAGQVGQKSEYLEHFLPAWWSVRMTDRTNPQGCFSSVKPNLFHHDTHLRRVGVIRFLLFL